MNRVRRNVAPHAGAWIETGSPSTMTAAYQTSLPTRERGLKHITQLIYKVDNKSLPTRERGLKLTTILRSYDIS